MRFRLTVLFLLGLAALPVPAATIFSASGAAKSDIQGALNDFRAALGTLNANQPVNFTGGRREINWDGVPAAFRDPFPGSFFNGSTPGRARGSVNTAVTGTLEVELPDSTDTYVAFSDPLVFKVVNGNALDQTFFSPSNQKTPATVTGMGVIFLDVDTPNAASLEFFGLGGQSLGKYFAPSVVGNNTFSFVGVKFDTPSVARVRITASTNNNTEAVMDDFLFGEPTAVPEPSSWAMAGAAAVGLAIARRRR